MSQIKRYLSVDEAVSILPDAEEIHTNIQKGMVFIGADWSREEIIDKIKKCQIRELTGPVARGMNHGLVLYNRDAKYQSDLLFVETDKAKLDAFDQPKESEE